jgi:TonB family protein
MAGREKFGKSVLLEETEVTPLGPEYRAAKLNPSGLEKLVTILRLKPEISLSPDVARGLMDQAKLAAQLQSPNILKIFGIGKVDQVYYITYELLEGKSLRAILDRCRQESYPFAIDHALLVASKVCAALEFAHARRTDSGARYLHGLLSPSSILVSYEGEVRVKGFGYWPSRLRESNALTEDDLRYLAPEQAAEGTTDPRSDIYALGAVLFEALTGEVPPQGAEAAALVASAKLASPAGDDDSMPKPLTEVLVRSLGREPAQRYAEAGEMRKAIDTHLFSGDFTPTTFNLAFFMHSLYRDDIETETRAVKEAKEASYAEFLVEESARRGTPPPPFPPVDSRTVPIDARLLGAAATPGGTAPASASLGEETHVADPSPTPSSPNESHPGSGARDAAAGFTFHKNEQEKHRGKTPLLLGSAASLALVGLGTWYFLTRPEAAVPAATAAPPSTTPAPEVLAAQAKVKELEEKLAAMEAERQQAEARAAEDATKRLEAQAKAKGQEVDPAAVQKAQDEARQKAQAEQDRRQQAELRRVQEEKRAEEARLLEDRRKSEEAAAATAAPERAATPPSMSPAAVEPTTTTLVGLRAGTLVNVADVGVIAPIVEKKPALEYPPMAMRQRVEGTVELSALVDDKGAVTDAQVVSAPGGRTGLAEAALDNVKRWRYRPATKDGIPVKVWITVRVRFELPK